MTEEGQAVPEESTPGNEFEVVEIDWTSEPPPLYSNYALVSHRFQGEFSVVLCAISDQDPAPDKNGKMAAKARIVASVRMQAESFFSLMNVMQQNWKQFSREIAELAAKLPREVTGNSKEGEEQQP